MLVLIRFSENQYCLCGLFNNAVRIYTSQRQVAGKVIHEELGRKRPWPNRGNIPEFDFEGLSKTTKTLVITVVPSGIRDQHLANTSLQRYHMSKLCANEPHSEACAHTHLPTQSLSRENVKR
jgi:hypothetical protein